MSVFTLAWRHCKAFPENLHRDAGPDGVKSGPYPRAQGSGVSGMPGLSPEVGNSGGAFVMGSPASEPGRFDSEGPAICGLAQSFRAPKFEITSAQFLAFLEDTRYQPVACNSRHGMAFAGPGRPSYPPAYEEPPKWLAVCLDGAMPAPLLPGHPVRKHLDMSAPGRSGRSDCCTGAGTRCRELGIVE